MTTVSEFIKFLETLPPDTIVETVETIRGNWESYAETVDIEIPDEFGYSDNIEVFDFRNNQFVGPNDSRFGQVFLRIGTI